MTTANLFSTQPTVTRQDNSNRLFWGALALVIVIGASWAAVFEPHHFDITWLTMIGHRVLGGEQLFVDVYDTNPPFSVGLYLPFVWLENVTGIRTHIWISLGYFSLLSASLAVSMRMMRDHMAMTVNQRRFVIVGLAAVLCCVMPTTFGQREHFGITAALPWFFLIAARAKSDAPISTSFGLTIGAMASILLLTKPFYALGLGLPLLYLAWQKQSWRAPFQPEAWTLGAIGIAYAAIVIMAFPGFFEFLPLIVDVYTPHRRSLMAIILAMAPYILPALLLALIVNPKDLKFDPLVMVFLSGLAGFVISFVAYGKFFFYLLWPALVCAHVAFFVQLVLFNETAKQYVRGAVLLGFASLVLFGLNWNSDQRERFRPQLPEVVQALTPNPKIGILSASMRAGVPLAHKLNAEWTERDPSDFIGDLAYRLLDRATPEHKARLEQHIIEKMDRKVAYLSQPDLDLIIVDTRESYWMDLVTVDGRILKILESYTLIAEQDRMQYYVPRGTVWRGPDEL